MAKKTNDKMVKTETDGLTKDQRRIRNLKLKADAKQRAFDEKLNWFDDIPAAQFHANFDNAFNIATTHAKAVELLVGPSAPIVTPIVVEQPKTIAEKADEAVERFEERNKTAELVAAAKAALTGNVANDNTETTDEPATTATSEEPAIESTTTDDAVVEAATAGEDTPVAEQLESVVPTATVETPVTETEVPATELKNEFDENGKLIRWPGESSKLYGRRAHKAKLAKWDKKPEVVAATPAEETRNGEPPVAEKSYPTGKLGHHSDHDGQSVQPKKALPGLPTGKAPSDINKTLPLDTPVELPEAIVDPMLKQPTESKKAWKARIALLNAAKAEVAQEIAAPSKSALESANVFEAATMNDETTATAVPDATETGTEEATTTEDPVADTPAEEAPNNQPAEVQEPVQTEPVSTPTEAPGPSEAKTDKKPTLTLVSSNPKPTRPASTVEGAKKFYGSSWNDERAANLTDAFHWLSCAVAEEEAGRPLDSGKGKLYLKQALINENKAFGEAQAMAA